MKFTQLRQQYIFIETYNAGCNHSVIIRYRFLDYSRIPEQLLKLQIKLETGGQDCHPLYDLCMISCSATEQEIKCQLLVTIVALKCFNTYILWESHFHQLFHFGLYVFLLSIILNPLFRRQLVQLPISFILSCDFGILWIIGLGTAEQCLEGNQCSSDGQRRRPLVLQDIQANSSGLRADIRMPYFSIKLHLRWLEWVIGWNCDVNVERSAFVTSIFLFINK